MIEVRPLTSTSWDELAAAFGEAFGDYAVPMAMSADALAAMQRRRGYAPEVSFGAFEGRRLIGFVLTCLDGDRAYNSGTGVIPARRRHGVARRLVEAVIASVGARTYLLEVLAGNAGAIAFYRSLGFAQTRRLRCWTYAAAGATAPELAAPDLDAIAAHADVAPSWQNAVASIRRASEPCVVLGDREAAAVVFPGSADLPLLAVARDARRRGHGARLLAAAASRCARPLRILNVDARAEGIAAFLAAVGAEPLVEQLEMVR